MQQVSVYKMCTEIYKLIAVIVIASIVRSVLHVIHSYLLKSHIFLQKFLQR